MKKLDVVDSQDKGYALGVVFRRSTLGPLFRETTICSGATACRLHPSLGTEGSIP